MKLTIWKFGLAAVDEQTVEMPKNAKILTVQQQCAPGRESSAATSIFVDGWALSLWALVDPTAPLVNRRVYCCGTGGPIPDVIAARVQLLDENGRYIATVQMKTLTMPLVWHFFDGGEEPLPDRRN
jgi:hypothetical protein